MSSVLRKIWPFAAAVLSGVLLWTAFPGGGAHASVAFFALVPLFFAAAESSPRRAAAAGFFAGAVFFTLSLRWLLNLTGMVDGEKMVETGVVLGYIALCLYCALYFVPAAVVASLAIRRHGTDRWFTALLWMVEVALVWVAAEFLRSRLFSGFGWNALGVSQYDSPALIQVAEWGGVFLVSATVVWMNAAIFVTLRRYQREGFRYRGYRPHIELIAGMLPLALSASYGMHVLINRPPRTGTEDRTLRVVLVQPNVPQDEKWSAKQAAEIRDRLARLSLTALHMAGVNLTIWPETALPDVLQLSPASRELVRKVVATGVPLLAGALRVEPSDEKDEPCYYNSSLLITTNGTVAAHYDKRHLVPFGEYVPFPSLLSAFTPVGGDICPGHSAEPLSLPGLPPFGVLICFEDTLPEAARSEVRAGARWLVNQTNDAWFDPSAQSEQHLAHAVFRCVENRIPMVRCCNSGVSCAIDELGIVSRHLRPRRSGFAIHEVAPRAAGAPLTFYARYGDVFAYCASAAAGLVVAGLLALRRKSGDEEEQED